MCGRLISDLWDLDNGCPRHMIGDRSNFMPITPIKRGQVTLQNNLKGKVIGKG